MDAAYSKKDVRSRRWALLALILGVAAVSTFWLWPVSGSPLRKTGRELDVAVFGRGFIRVKDSSADVVYYTRCGDLHLDRDSRLVTQFGGDSCPLDPAVFIPFDWISIEISRDGRVRVAQPGEGAMSDVGQIELTCFPNAEGLREVMPGVFQETEDSGVGTTSVPGANGLGFVVQRWLESHPSVQNPRSGLSDSLAIVAVGTLGWGALELRRQRRSLKRLEDAIESGCRPVSSLTPPPTT
jgi:flagellar basal body rod protein FlgG